jgi:sortase A
MKRALLGGLVIPVLIIGFGLGLLLYPKLSDWRYTKFQEKLEAAIREDASTSGTIFARSSQANSKKSRDIQPIPDGTVAKLLIPKIELGTYVLSGTTPKVLNKGTGHYEETPLPGEEGNCAIAGHRTMYGHPFRYLDRLEAGHKVIVYTPNKKSIYKVVEKKIVKPTDLSVIAPTEESRLTLTTCNPVGSARQRLVIVAELEGE